MENNQIFEAISKINSMISVVRVLEVIESHPARDSGTYLLYSCPFHSDSTPSMYVSMSLNSYNCFSCSRGGGPYSLVKEYLMFSVANPNAKVSYHAITKWIGQNIDPRVLEIPVKSSYSYRPDPMKKTNFYKLMSESPPPVSFYLSIKTPEQKRAFISSIMKGFDDENIKIMINNATEQPVGDTYSVAVKSESAIVDDLWRELVQGGI